MEAVLRQFLLSIVMALGLSLGLAGGVSAQDAALADRVLGKVDAPVTILEYASLTCNHCAAFHKETLPKIKQAYIDTGKAKLVFIDFPFDRVGLQAAMLARCVDPARYFGFLEVLFRGQETWADSEKTAVGNVRKLAKLSGLTDQAADACLKNDVLMDKILKGRQEAETRYKVDATPSFIIGDEKIAGARPFEDFQKALDAAFAKAKK